MIQPEQAAAGQVYGEEILRMRSILTLSFDKPGILAMANRGPDTNGSQFFITTAPTTWLNGHHTIFGHGHSGYDIVSKIENTPTGTGDRPVQDQKIIKAYVK